LFVLRRGQHRLLSALAAYPGFFLRTLGATDASRNAAVARLLVGMTYGLVHLDLRREARTRRPALEVPEHLVPAAVRTWSVRMVNEYMSSRVFAALADQMGAASYDAEGIRQCRRFSDEEKKHGVLCGAVVEALGGEARASTPEPPEFPVHADVSLQEGLLRNLLSICCLSETVAVALIGADRLEMPEGALRRLLTEIYADEIGHARFGWVAMAKAAATLDDSARRRLGDYLRVAFAHLEAHELAHLPESSYRPPGGETLGLCSGADGRTLFYDAVREVIVPGLTKVGLGAERAWELRGQLDFGCSATSINPCFSQPFRTSHVRAGRTGIVSPGLQPGGSSKG
jgi:hypothetical protein